MEDYLGDMLVKSIKSDLHTNDLMEAFKCMCLYNVRLNPSKCVFKVRSTKFQGFMVSEREFKSNPEKLKAIE